MSSAASLYSSVISDVISSIRESFLDEAVDEQVLQELKTLWEQKLAQSKTVDPNNRGQEALLDAKMAAGRSAGKLELTNSGSEMDIDLWVNTVECTIKYDFFQFLPITGGTSAVSARSTATSAVGATGGTQLNGSDETSTNSGAAANAPQLVITNPDRLVPVQITIPAQPGNPASVPRALTVQVPAHALQQTGPTSQMLQQVLTQAITQALTLPESHAAVFLQNQINTAFRLND